MPPQRRRTRGQAENAPAVPRDNIPEAVLLAKQTVSPLLLRPRLTVLHSPMAPARDVRSAVASAGLNIHAVGIGRKLVEGRPTGDYAVRLYVVQKIAPSLLPPRDRLPESIDGIPTDVIESPVAYLAGRLPRPPRAPRPLTAAAPCTDNRTHRQRPVIGGISAAHYDVTGGTLGYFCRSTRHGDDPNQVYALSNNHIFANLNAGHHNDALYQPSPADNATTADYFAVLHRFVPLALGGAQPNRVDAAIGTLLPVTAYQATICQIGPVTGITPGLSPMPVRKHGRTSGYTEGTIVDHSVDQIVYMDHGSSSVTALFQQQMRIEGTPQYPAFATHGDSGSLIISGSNATGLYFAGPDSGSYGLANHIADVLSELEVTLV